MPLFLKGGNPMLNLITKIWNVYSLLQNCSLPNYVPLWVFLFFIQDDDYVAFHIVSCYKEIETWHIVIPNTISSYTADIITNVPLRWIITSFYLNSENYMKDITETYVLNMFGKEQYPRFSFCI